MEPAEAVLGLVRIRPVVVARGHVLAADADLADDPLARRDLLPVVRQDRELIARKVLGRPGRRKLAHAFLWECSYKRLKLAQLLGQLGVVLTWM